ncbi:MULTISPECIES: SDR family NAD(P)-dependent oxidoreductase [Lentzea]|jgi:NAD(P)-dependent dehydrogenase (short-subunit alcohol dehydrogenase family)|uniref:NAD(P)-dependent dehydrogenase, short-chain alcohol dehydrogenase family n=1 Tax=Lentzea flaviverrucosa TaxID=200379 RepID=A0A1H9W7K3_9PSEU|nr:MULTISPECIES: SDR family oxidoreductase [Lentzea]MCR3751247.1 NAD(P)-dependent dehydrogenase, short-chain alcohol dehydrogenase family [Lentzea californiensis]RDI22331.1 NAD(P)-dependent dehydrogenase (short-subunit alcohol dehydrogenase family) [Lentzea flaviverrucosa]SES29751.1 NAD(P)-dependent dehydrogenase, short-chain alcohol dehydrogenase family [Lentzea flaviverrucosa]
MDLSGRTALVTGSTAGIGFASAESLLKAGATVVITGRTEERVAEAVGKLSAGGDVRGVAADLATAEGAADLVAQVPDVDVLVNNLGIYGAKPVFEIDDAEWQRYFDTNIMSGVRLARHYTPRMVERGWGRVIFVSSESGVFTPTEMVHYGMTKTAQIAISRGMAQEVKGTGVTVNSVLPGPTLTPGVEEFIRERVGEGGEAEFVRTERPTLLLGRLIRPHEVANLITYVASDLSSATTGAALRVDGGTAPTLIP